MTDYSSFIRSKSQHHSDSGFTPNWMPGFLFDFQSHLVDWAIRKGRSAIFADCGLGKTPMQLVWAENVLRETNKPVLILTPLAVSYQTIREADKFGIECHRSIDGSHKGSITVANYEKLQYFKSDDFGGMVCDESGILKNFNGKTRSAITEFMRSIPYRLLCTATAAPNDFIELGNSSEALGYLGFQDMVNKFFREEKSSNFTAWGRSKYRFRGHAETPFWQWVCSWARACRKPSDIGFSDEGFDLPPLLEQEHVIPSLALRDGMLFPLTAQGLGEQREEKRLSIEDRCKYAYELTSSYDEQVILWCHLNDEGDILESMIPGSVQVSGSMKDEEKEERFLSFFRGDIQYLITNPKSPPLGSTGRIATM